jgi:multiple sugar transport system permease protein
MRPHRRRLALAGDAVPSLFRWRSGILSAGIFAFTLSWNKFIYALVFLSSPAQKAVPVGVTSELIRSDVFFWGAGGCAAGLIPVATPTRFRRALRVGLTGSVKG